MGISVVRFVSDPRLPGMKLNRIALAWMMGVAGVTAGAAEARTNCVPSPQGPHCVSEIDFASFAQQAYMQQTESAWCWAASISMVFAYYGHPVSQAEIVTSVYGSTVNLPAQTGAVIARELDRVWTDDRGETFRAQLTGVFDVDAGVAALTNAQIVNELDQDRPMVIGNQSHAMVLTAIEYFATPNGPFIVGAGVFDPWPGIGPRMLQQPELLPIPSGGQLRFLATVRVTDAGPPPPRPDPDPNPDPGPGRWAPDPDPQPYESGGCSTTRGASGELGVILSLVALVIRRARA